MTTINSVSSLQGLIQRAHKVIAVSKKLTKGPDKKLKASDFCGPNRTFPVADVDHVDVARAYLGRAKFPEDTKKKIEACINKKAKALGYKAKATITRAYPIYIELSYVQKQLYTSYEFKTTKVLVEKSLKSPGKSFDGIDLYV